MAESGEGPRQAPRPNYENSRWGTVVHYEAAESLCCYYFAVRLLITGVVKPGGRWLIFL